MLPEGERISKSRQGESEVLQTCDDTDLAHGKLTADGFERLEYVLGQRVHIRAQIVF